jgi:hypothetical protein
MNPETTEIYEDKLEDVREVVMAAKTLIESEDDNIRLEAIDLFIQLSELELALVHALSEEPETQAEERNPLVRRLRLAT